MIWKWSGQKIIFQSDLKKGAFTRNLYFFFLMDKKRFFKTDLKTKSFFSKCWLFIMLIFTTLWKNHTIQNVHTITSFSSKYLYLVIYGEITLFSSKCWYLEKTIFSKWIWAHIYGFMDKKRFFQNYLIKRVSLQNVDIFG